MFTQMFVATASENVETRSLLEYVKASMNWNYLSGQGA